MEETFGAPVLSSKTPSSFLHLGQPRNLRVPSRDPRLIPSPPEYRFSEYKQKPCRCYTNYYRTSSNEKVYVVLYEDYCDTYYQHSPLDAV